MNADISDAPERVNRRLHKRGAFSMVICLIVGCAATIGAFQAINRAPGIDAAYQPSMSSNGGEGAVIRASGIPPKQDPGISQLQAGSDIDLPANTARQTVFNDQNFTARGADNVLNFRVASVPSPPKELPKPVKLTIVGQPPRLKDQECRYLKQGSIEARNCRAWIGLRHRN